MIADILFKGAEHPTTAKALCRLTGFGHRELTAQIERERRQGQPICASCDNTRPGYYLAADRNEMQRYCGRLSHRLKEIAETLQGCRSSLEQLPEGAQMMIDCDCLFDDEEQEEPTDEQILQARAQLMGKGGAANGNKEKNNG